LVEESTSEHMRVYPSAPPSVMLSRLAAECSEVQVLSRRRQPAAVQARLSGAAALLATMCADALMRLGGAREAKLWYRTAIHAADDSADTRLRVLVRAQAAMLPYYFGDPQQTVAMADQALAITATASPSGALAAASRARALARLGAADQARAAIEQAHHMFDEGGDEDSDAAFRFPAKRLMFYLSGARTWLGDTKEAYRVQDEALRLYGSSPRVAIDPALIALDRALCLVRDLRFPEAAVAAREAVANLPELQRTEIILTKAIQVLSAIPAQAHDREVLELAEYVQSCRERSRTLAAGTAALEP
jgi:tetratricopeptide (TPR) repeat protein